MTTETNTVSVGVPILGSGVTKSTPSPEYTESPETDKFWPAYLKARRNFKMPKKTSENPFYGSKYADHAEVMGCVDEALLNEGIIILQPPVTRMNHYGAQTRLVHCESGQWISTLVTFTPDKETPQGQVGCITYAKRTGLQSLTALPSFDDDDGQTASGLSNSPKKAQNAPRTVGNPGLDSKVSEMNAAAQQHFSRGVGGIKVSKEVARRNYNDFLKDHGFTHGTKGSFTAVKSIEDAQRMIDLLTAMDERLVAEEEERGTPA